MVPGEAIHSKNTDIKLIHFYMYLLSSYKSFALTEENLEGKTHEESAI